MNKPSDLQILNSMMSRTCTCSLKDIALNVVIGEGNAHARIMFIGEAPGKKEDETGKPFVGASGRLLNEMLATINLSRDDIYITNIVKYRPPNNRDPLAAEVSECWPWLAAQIDLIDPDLIIPLGRHALERFAPGKKISEEHGKSFELTVPGLGKRTYLALYHPAASLYNGSLRGTLFADFAKIPRALEKAAKR